MFALEGITADELAEAVRFVSGSAPVRAHLVENYARTHFRRLPSRFAAGKACTDDVNWIQI